MEACIRCLALKRLVAEHATIRPQHLKVEDAALHLCWWQRMTAQRFLVKELCR
jgi:hypothetical protein